MLKTVIVFVRLALLIILSLFLFLGTNRITGAQGPETDVQWEKAISIPSPAETSSWFPDLAVDSQGRVHVAWNETDHGGVGNTKQTESIYYSMWDGQHWSRANDIVPPQKDIIRQAIAMDQQDVLHIVFGWFNMYYEQARANEALSARAWTSPRLINSRAGTYMKDVVAFQDTLHVVYDDEGDAGEDVECPGCGDIFYRHSPDLGLTWSAPMALFPTETGSARAQLEVDKKGVVYVTWDEGWDRFTDYKSSQFYGIYMYSTDDGNTWSEPVMVSYPNSTNVQLTVGADGEGGVMLVWRTTSPDYPGIFYMWSVDYGASWSPPKTLPNIVAQGFDNPFDKYDMATDSAGHIHLLVTGNLSTNHQQAPGLYDFTWDGKSWSYSTVYEQDPYYPHYPSLVINQGNQLHATWFVRKGPWGATMPEPYRIWYAHGQAQAPAETPIVQPTPTLTPTPTATPNLLPTPTSRPPTPTPTLDPGLAHVSVPSGATESIYTDMDDVFMLVISLIPAALIVIIVVVGVRFFRR